jgi:Zn-dependent membrane protease YugP
MQTLEAQGILYNDELDGAYSVLNAAAMTYVAALATSLLTLLRLLVIANGRKR